MRWGRKLTHSENRCTVPMYLSDGTIAYLSDDRCNENFQICMIDRKGNKFNIFFKKFFDFFDFFNFCLRENNCDFYVFFLFVHIAFRHTTVFFLGV